MRGADAAHRGRVAVLVAGVTTPALRARIREHRARQRRERERLRRELARLGYYVRDGE